MTSPGFPARQVLIGVLVPVLFLLLLAGLARRSWRYEKVRPPFHGDTEPDPRKVTASALQGGLAHPEFWDGEDSVRLLTEVHLAAAAGFLAVVLGVTAKLLTAAGSAHRMALWWIAIGRAGSRSRARSATSAWTRSARGCTDAMRLRRWLPVPLLRPGGGRAWSARVCSRGFSPLRRAARTAELPGMASVIGWTALAIAVALALALVSMLLGLRGSRGTLIGGPWVTLMLGFILLNTVMLGVGIWVAHLVGPVTGDAADVAGSHAIYVPYLITSGVPLVAWAAVVAVVVFGLVELARWWRVRQLPATMRDAYRDQAQAFMAEQPGAPDLVRIWPYSAASPSADRCNGDRSGRECRPNAVPGPGAAGCELAAVGRHRRAAGHSAVRLAVSSAAARWSSATSGSSSPACSCRR